MRHVRTQEISCQCYDGWSGPECAASLMTDPLLTPGPVEESPDEPYLISPGIIGLGQFHIRFLYNLLSFLVLLLLASLCVVAYVVKKCQKYPQSSVIQLRASRKADRAAALDLLETDPHHAKFSIDLDED